MKTHLYLALSLFCILFSCNRESSDISPTNKPATTSTATIDDLPTPTTYKVWTLAVNNSSKIGNSAPAGVTANVKLETAPSPKGNGIKMTLTVNDNGKTETVVASGLYLVFVNKGIRILYRIHRENDGNELGLISRLEIYYTFTSADGSKSYNVYATT